jgi:two-component system, NarL family, invasion response regulator UvrY
MLNILIADDHAIVRRGLKDMVTEEFTQARIIEVSTGQAAIEAVRKQAVEVVILDLNLPDKTGIEVLKELKLLRPNVPVLVLSVHPEEQYAARALKAGAAGYVTKNSAPEELVTAIKKVLQGGKYVSPALAEQLAKHIGVKTDGPLHQTLSDREDEVLRLIANGKTPTEIADHLSLSVKTVSTYRARLLEKLRLKTTADLIRYAVDNKLVE